MDYIYILYLQNFTLYRVQRLINLEIPEACFLDILGTNL